jgi:glycosyltransferase involved in cell wall biosynthesis
VEPMKNPEPELLSIIVPVYNEQQFVEAAVRRVLEQNWRMEVIIVDDGSSDGTPEIVARLAEEFPEVLLLTHDKNSGKGAALRTGFAQATGEILIIQDADLEYDPADYPKLLGPILDGRADVVYGSRFLGGPHRVLNFHHYVANRALTTLSNVLTNLNLTDMETCYKVFRREVLESVTLRRDDFGFEPEFTAQIAAAKMRVYEVPISYSGRDYDQGKKITPKDGLKALWVIVSQRRYR